MNLPNAISAVTKAGVLATALLLSGCGASIGTYSTTTETETQLNRGNYKVVESGVIGKASCWYLFSAIPLGSMELYRQAMDQIRRQIASKGKPIALVNITQDLSTTSFVVVSRADLTLTADIIEFTD